MDRFWTTKKFKALCKEWDKKLVESGFIDAEVSVKGDRVLRQRASNCYRQASEFDVESKLTFYSTLGHLTHNTQFPTWQEALIMTRYAEGAKICAIVKELELRGYPRDRKTIRFIIRRWTHKWGIKNWNLKQRNLRKEK